MYDFLPDYRDPIVSVALMILIAVAVALAAHIWNLYRQRKRASRLRTFLEKFDTASCSLEEQEVPFEEGMAKPLLLLARAFEQSGTYDKTISILLYLIRHTRDDELMVYLGKVYLRAGFLQRAEEIFLEILSRHPRRPDVLLQLEILYEKMRDYPRAREVIETLRANGEDVASIGRYVRFLELRSATGADRFEALTRIAHEDSRFYRPVLAELFRIDPSQAWERLDPSRVNEVLDLLWYLPAESLRLDIIAADPTLEAIFFARGEIDARPQERSGIFAVDTLAAARQCGYAEGELRFSYLCKECKRSFPVSFVRCPGCMALNSIEVEETLGKRRDQRSDTLF
ncbi:tetratricopeptide repeat protein [Nitratifractor sp.]